MFKRSHHIGGPLLAMCPQLTTWTARGNKKCRLEKTLKIGVAITTAVATKESDRNWHSTQASNVVSDWPKWLWLW